MKKNKRIGGCFDSPLSFCVINKLTILSDFYIIFDSGITTFRIIKIK